MGEDAVFTSEGEKSRMNANWGAVRRMFDLGMLVGEPDETRM